MNRRWRHWIDDPLARRRLIGAGIMLVILAVLLPVYMAPPVQDCSSTVLGAPGDGTTGSVWLNWAWDETGGSPFTSTQNLTGAGRGDPLWQPVMTVNSAWSIPMWGLSRITNPVCGYNAIIMVGFVTTGLAMWSLCYAITRSRVASALGGIAYGFTAFAQIKAGGHLSGVMLAAFPLLLLGLLRIWARPTWKRSILAALPWAALAYTDGYYLAFSLVVVCAFTATGASIELVSRSDFRQLLRRIAHVALSGLTALVLLIPFAMATLGNRSTIDAERRRGLNEVNVYGARPWEYLVPPANNPLSPQSFTEWRQASVHGSNLAESTLYLGWVILVLGAFAIVATLRRRFRSSGLANPGGSDSFDRADPDLVPDRILVVGSLVGVAIVAFVSSLPPNYEFFGVGTPMPSRLIHGVFPQMRVLSRLFVVVSCATVALAAVGFCEIVKRWRHRWSVFALGSVMVLISLTETLAADPFAPPVWSFSQSPVAYETVSRDATVDLVARYPLEATNEDPGKAFLTFQLALDRPLVNPITDSSDADDSSDMARGLAALDDPQTVPTLRALGVDMILSEVQRMGPGEKDEAQRLGLDLVRSFRYDVDDAPRQIHGGARRWAYLSPYYDIDQYRILDGPVATAFVALGRGWSFFEGEGWGGTRWMTGDGELTLVPLPNAPQSAEVRFHLASFGFMRELHVWDGDMQIASITVPVGGTEVAFEAPTGRTLQLRSTPGPTAISQLVPSSSDSRSLSFVISDIEVNG